MAKGGKIGILALGVFIGTGFLSFYYGIAYGGHASHGAHWGYTGEAGPEHWGDINHDYALCEKGMKQSPIDISGGGKAGSFKIETAYKKTPLKVLNNGHTIQVNYSPGSSMKVDGMEYRLLQFHFHSPSENTYEGRVYDMEAHLVHKSDPGQLAVICVFLKKGKENRLMRRIWDNIPKEINKEKTVSRQNVNVTDLLPKDLAAFHFIGSLTTPPCSEGVNWYVLKTPIEASEDQINTFISIIGKNARPVQPLNNRKVIETN